MIASNEFENHCKQTAAILNDCDACIFLAGAGMSADSGLPVYQDIDLPRQYTDNDINYRVVYYNYMFGFKHIQCFSYIDAGTVRFRPNSTEP